MERSIGQKETIELAVMVDTFRPLMVTEAAMKIDDGEYHMASGKETWVKVTSEPAWTSEDQIPIEEGTKFQ